MEPIIRINSPPINTIVSSFTLRVSYTPILTSDDILAIYINDNLFKEVNLSTEIKINDLPLSNDEIFDIALAVVREGTIMCTTKASPYKYKKTNMTFPLVKEKVEYYIVQDSCKLPEDVANVLILSQEQEKQGQDINIIVPASRCRLQIVNCSKRSVNLLEDNKEQSLVHRIQRYTVYNLENHK